jgi:hypothetical protein
MLISNIIGGLGNQMFQYATARALSIDLNTQLVLDISDFDGYSLHQGFELNRVFNCEANIASDDDLSAILHWQKSKLARRLLKKFPFNFLRSKKFVLEPSFQYWSGIKNIADNSYLMGYWQSESYFSHHAETIRSDFRFKPELTSKNTEVLAHINEANAVSLHVRRGDYVQNAHTNATHGVCSLQYYKNAIDQIANSVKAPVFFVFSDDIEWVKSNLQIDFPCFYIDHNHGIDSFNDMRLMSNCQHHIIANSSFSWWGAWLNANPEKIVIAPKQWFANNTNVSDLLPKGWIKL